MYGWYAVSIERVKTVYDPGKEKRDQPITGTTNIAQSGSGQPRRRETPPTGGKNLLMRVRMEGLIDPQEGGEVMMEVLMVMGVFMEMAMAMGIPMEMAIQMIMVIQMGMEIQVGMESHPGEGKSLLEGMENKVKVVEGQIPVMMMEMEMNPPLLHQRLHHLEEEDIGGPDLFM